MLQGNLQAAPPYQRPSAQHMRQHAPVQPGQQNALYPAPATARNPDMSSMNLESRQGMHKGFSWCLDECFGRNMSACWRLCVAMAAQKVFHELYTTVITATAPREDDVHM